MSWQTEQAPLDAPATIGVLIAEAVPELETCIDRVTASAHQYLTFLHGTTEMEHGIDVAMIQMTNDFFDVLYDVSTGRGRSVLRGARTLFELLVTVLDIRGNPKMDARYYDYRWVSAQLEADLSLEAKFLPKKDRSADLHRRKKLRRDSAKGREEAVTKYGKNFRLSWSPNNLATRANRHGLDEEYAFYRFASAVLHGTAGAAVGLESELEGRVLFRVGPALALCPMAFLYALHFFSKVAAATGDRLGGPALPDLRVAIREAQALWPNYRRAVMRIDRKLWPTALLDTLIAVLAFTDQGRTEQWYLHNTAASTVVLAEPLDENDLTEAERRSLAVLREYAPQHPSVAEI